MELKFSPERLKIARKLKGYTQTEVANALKAGMRTVQDWEYGRMAPSGQRLQALAELLDQEAGYFFVNVPDPFIPARVEFYRKRAGITQDALALILGHPKRVIKSWEAGTLVPNSGQKDMLETWIESVIEEKGGPTFEEWKAQGSPALTNPIYPIRLGNDIRAKVQERGGADYLRRLIKEDLKLDSPDVGRASDSVPEATKHRPEILSLESIPFESRPKESDNATLAKSRFGPKTDYVLVREAMHELEQAQEQMKFAQARLAAATERMAELMGRQMKMGD